MDTAVSKNNFNIRLTSERWIHITEGHPELAGYYFEILNTIENPDTIYGGGLDEFLAVKEIDKDKFLIVVYKEVSNKDGFVITAFISKRINYLLNKNVVWKKQN